MKITLQKSKLLTALTLVIALSSCQASVNSNVLSNNKSQIDEPSKTIVSTYKDGQVTLRDVNIEIEKIIAQNEKLKGLTFEKFTAEQKEAIIKEVVLKKVIYKEGKKRNLNEENDYQEALKIFETELLKQKLFITLVKDSTDDKNVKKNYDQLVTKLKDKKDIRISYIAVKTESEANSIYQNLLKSPKSFSALAKTKSLDKEVGKKGGDLGFVMEDIIAAEIVKQAKTVAKGKIAKPIFSSGKWIIIKFEDERPTEIMPYEKAKDTLAKNLAKKAIEDFISQNLEKAKINILSK